ncbi:hypothetical protein GDO78_001603 [Eleutherodactylus coqui]|uniref:Uncharacterized protein n=1 Tax=Eleutherodactylus coqui TaxID=57060 RepID=A0A8J6FW99_ELECQ|nr:hypothetical protein GDO78_001603 [Eleutherodactylus coqui]
MSQAGEGQAIVHLHTSWLLTFCRACSNSSVHDSKVIFFLFQYFGKPQHFFVNMVLCYRRITPGYIRLLQVQTASKIIINGTDILMGRAAVLFGAIGIWISTYSTRQMIK